ncbi:NAD(P)-binding protein [Polyplosphaeria fusca]|uniref:NAD(P)-binding protein n=1 Tax=Polyplosphaeria fusca TaxID=682080 RepID=A0A9P4UWI4_9PLEO|nr:NAD(P)-binding protein [Polyplosphaeria fusca]
MSSKTVLITGCSAGGIGSSLAHAFATRNHLVFATLRNTSKLDPSLASFPNVHVLALDTTSSSSIAAAVEVVSARSGARLDFLINNAGSGLVGPFLDTDLGAAKALFDVNFWGVLECIQGFKEMLVEAGGTVVNVSSIAGVAPDPYQSVYNASKAALTHFSATLRLELAPLRVRVVTLHVGMIQSQWYANSVNSDLVLPEDSYYHLVLQQIRDGLDGKASEKQGTNVDVFAEEVVRKVLEEGKTGAIWAGALEGTFKWMQWLPNTVLERFLSKKAGLDKPLQVSTTP